MAWSPQGSDQERAISTALGNRIAATCCRTEQELWEELCRPSVRVFVLDVGTRQRPNPAGLVAAVRGRFPAMRIVGVGRVTESLSAEIMACARSGLDALALRGYSDLGATIDRVLAESGLAEERILRDVGDWLPNPLRDAVRVLLQRLDDAPSLSQLARMLGVGLRTLQRAAQQRGCAAPSDIVCGIRVLVGIHLLTIDAQPMAFVLRRTGYPSTRALHSAMRRCGLTDPRHLRGEAGYAAARDQILSRISSAYADRLTLDIAMLPSAERPATVPSSAPDVISRELEMRAAGSAG